MVSTLNEIMPGATAASLIQDAAMIPPWRRTRAS